MCVQVFKYSCHAFSKSRQRSAVLASLVRLQALGFSLPREKCLLPFPLLFVWPGSLIDFDPIKSNPIFERASELIAPVLTLSGLP